MGLPLRATYTHGAFVPDEPCELPEGAKVTLTVHRRSRLTPPSVTDSDERQRILDNLVDRMNASPLAADAPRLSRDDLHERR